MGYGVVKFLLLLCFYLFLKGWGEGKRGQAGFESGGGKEMRFTLDELLVYTIGIFRTHARKLYIAYTEVHTIYQTVFLYFVSFFFLFKKTKKKRKKKKERKKETKRA